MSARTIKTSTVRGCMPSACPAAIFAGLSGTLSQRARHATWSKRRPHTPLVNHSYVDASPSKPMGAHEPSGPGSYDKYIDFGLFRNGGHCAEHVDIVCGGNVLGQYRPSLLGLALL